jgi:membrane-associated phospholipid phosphatase
MRSILSIVLVFVFTTPVHADDPGPLEADPVVDGAVILGATAATLGLHFLRVNDSPDPWDRELFGSLDQRARANFSARARTLSNAGIVASVAIPAAFTVGTTWDEAAGDRALVFGESVAGALVFASLVKAVVGRPRPYTYSKDPAAVAYAKAHGRDARRSFFSAHATTAFAAVAAGGALYAGRDGDKGNRAMVWAAGAAAASATANFRVRSGDHFYSDVAIGAIVGLAAGTIGPAIHTGKVYKPSGAEWAAFAGGIVVGAAISELIPLGDDEAPAKPGAMEAQLAPLVLPSGGGGLGVVGTW